MASALPISRDRDSPAPPGLLFEAGLAIVVASIAIRLLSFDRLATVAETDRETRRSASAGEAYWIRRAVTAWGRRLPWRAKCFEQGIAAAWMLRRRDLRATLHYGLLNGQDLEAHVWVTSGEQSVVGQENSVKFTEVDRFGN